MLQNTSSVTGAKAPKVLSSRNMFLQMNDMV